MDKTRCDWLDGSDVYRDYHDYEWGKPCHDDNKLFEMLTLEAFQAGLSWITILKKREAFREAFDNFDPEIVANYGDDKVEALLENEKIIRHSGKIQAAINNAKLYLEIQKAHGSFNHFIWSYVDFVPIQGSRGNSDEVVGSTPLSTRISKDMKKMGFKFLGPTIVYAFMQATGIVNDHCKNCFLYEDVNDMSSFT